MQEYVIGIAFNESGEDIVLIQKDHGPTKNVGKWIGPGGKIEPGESPHEAMHREFGEETGVYIPVWNFECEYENIDKFRIFVFSCFNDNILGARTQESEEVDVFKVENLPFVEVPMDLLWMVHISLDSGIEKPVRIKNIED